MRYRTFTKLVLLISAFSVLTVTYGARLLVYLESGQGLREVTCDQKTDEQMAEDEGKADPAEDQKACWSTLTDIRPQILTDTSSRSVTDTLSNVVTDASSNVVTEPSSGVASETPSEAFQ